MQWIVELALKRPYTFVVMGILILFLGAFTWNVTPKDIFPSIDIPVVSVIWQYSGMAAHDVEKRLVTNAERALTTTVNDIEHIESQSITGVGIIKIFFHPEANPAAAVAEVTAVLQTILKQLPAGTTPPQIMRYNASSVPVLQLGLESQTLTEQQLYDLGTQTLRTGLATVQGAFLPNPYGGKTRQVQIDIDPDALMAKGLSPNDVSNTIGTQNLILPAGPARIGDLEYQVRLNGSPNNISEMNDMPIKSVNGAPINIGDVGSARDGYAVQANAVSIDGRPAVLMNILKGGKASTLDVVQRVRSRLPEVLLTVPKELNVKMLFDQSRFVESAIHGVIHEAVLAAVLTALMILLFLGSWRSTLIVSITIPLSILTSIIALGAMGETLNIMTLGGLALAVGILVDDATVEIENIHRNLGMGKGLRTAILDGAAQIATPTLVSTLSICVVFVSVVFLTGPAKYLFTPMALSVVFAMLASYMLSRTVIPNLVRTLLSKELHLYHGDHHSKGDNGWIWRLHVRFEETFERLQEVYGGQLARCLLQPRKVITGFGLFFLGSMLLLPLIGQDFFPSVDAGQFRLHVRTPAGTRLEETMRRFHQVEVVLRRIIPADEIETVVDNIGIPSSGINLSSSDSAVMGPNDGEILVALKPEHAPTASYIAQIRRDMPRQFPDMVFYFQPGDIVNQILNFGMPAPIDIEIVGYHGEENYALAQKIRREVSEVKGAVDVRIHQIVNQPTLDVTMDRQKALRAGMQARDIANSILVSLSGSGQVSPNFWLDPKSGNSYLISAQPLPRKLDSVQSFLRTPMNGSGGQVQQLSNLATVERGTMQANINHYDVQPTFNIYANVQDRDLGRVAGDIDGILAKYRQEAPRGTVLRMRGQVESMRESFSGLGKGILFAILLVYLLMVVNFQSWIDPLIIIMALPGALSGILWMLFLTQTTFNVPSLMGTIMCVGMAVANSILVVTFANERRVEGDDSHQAAHISGLTRLRPVMMTAMAMMIGMVPMAFGMGEGGEQNAPLGRAVIGGLIVATFTTLYFVPVIYSLLRVKPQQELDPPDPLEDSLGVTLS